MASIDSNSSSAIRRRLLYWHRRPFLGWFGRRLRLGSGFRCWFRGRGRFGFVAHTATPSLAATAASTSPLVTLPSLPVPLIWLMSTPRDSACSSAAGVASTCWAAAVVLAAASAAACASSIGAWRFSRSSRSPAIPRTALCRMPEPAACQCTPPPPVCGSYGTKRASRSFCAASSAAFNAAIVPLNTATSLREIPLPLLDDQSMATRRLLDRPHLADDAALGDEPLHRVASRSPALDLRLRRLEGRTLAVNRHVLAVQARADVLLQLDRPAARIHEPPHVGARGQLLKVGRVS